MSTEPRSVREMRLAIREAEDGLRRLQEASMMAGNWRGEWDFRAARAKLRHAEREFAKADEHPEPLKPLSPQTRERTPTTRPRRRRHRCSACWRESLMSPEDLERDPLHYRVRKNEDGDYERVDCGEWRPVRRMPAGKAV